MLRVLRLNDRPVKNDRADGGLSTIISWNDMQRFWGASPVTIPDIVLCDINFEYDFDSPLNEVHRIKPTGLLYAIPFLAAARTGLTPVVLKFHTGDPTLFSRIHDRESPLGIDKPPKEMSYLAAELIGLALAIATPDPSFSGPTLTFPLKTQDTWDWLMARDSSFESEAGAHFAAEKEYRRRLASLCVVPSSEQSQLNGQSVAPLVVDPVGYRKLVEWCARTCRNQTVDWEGEPGLLLTRPDGTKECLSIRGLFSASSLDVFVPKNFEVRLPANAEVRIPHAAWLNKNEEPLVGDFVAFLGGWPRLYDLVVSRLDRWLHAGPAVPARTVIDVFPAQEPHYALARLLALIFQTVDVYYQARQDWEARFTEWAWDPRARSFEPNDVVNRKATLKELLSVLARKLRSELDDQAVASEELEVIITDGTPIQNDGDAKYHLGLLTSIGVLTQTKDGLFTLRARFPVELPACPPELASEGLRNLQKTVLRSLGHESDAAQHVGRIIADALFKGESGDRKMGTKFWQDMIAGSLPGWLRQLAVIYAEREKNWRRDQHWPSFLIGS
jgi:hypothetical protein